MQKTNDLYKDLKFYSVAVGDRFLLEHTKRKFKLPGSSEEDMAHLHVQTNKKIFKCIAYVILLTKDHENHIVIGDSKKDIIENATGCSIRSSYDYFCLAEAMGFIKLIDKKDGKVYYQVASVIDYCKDNIKLKSRNSYKLEFNQKISVIKLADKLREAAFALSVAKMSRFAERIFKGCLKHVNNPNRKFKEDKCLSKEANALMVALLQEIREVINNGNEFVDISKPSGNWKFDLIHWLKRRISAIICSRSYNCIRKILGISRTQIARIIKVLKGRVVRVQHNAEEISYDEFLGVMECSYSKKNVFQFRDKFFRRMPNSYMIAGSLWTELAYKDEDPVKAIVKKKFVANGCHKNGVVRSRLSKRWFYLAAHPEVRAEIARARKERSKICK